MGVTKQTQFIVQCDHCKALLLRCKNALFESEQAALEYAFCSGWVKGNYCSDCAAMLKFKTVKP